MQRMEGRLASIGIRAVQPYALEPGVPAHNRELPSVEPALVFNTGAPISIIDAAGQRLDVGTGEAFFAGLHQRFCFSCCSGSQSGVQVRLSAQAAWRLFGPGAAACADRAYLVTDVADRRFTAAWRLLGPPHRSSAREAVVALLAEALVDAPEPCPDIGWAIDRLASPGASVTAIAAQLGWSRRRLTEQCRQTIGITPKVFGRIARYQRLLSSLDDDVSWAARAVDAGYFDQSHMVREFVGFTGLSPAVYLSKRVPFVQ